MSDKESSIIAGKMKLGDNSSKNDESKPYFKSIGSNIKSEIGDEIKEKELDIKDEGATVSSFHHHSDEYVDGNLASVNYQQPNREGGGVEYGYKSNESNDIKSEIGDEFLMEKEEFDIKVEVPTNSSFHSTSDQDIDGNVASVSYQQPNRKREEVEYGFKSNESDIKSEFGEEILMDIKEEEIYIKEEIPTTSSFYSESDQDVDGNVASISYQQPNWKSEGVEYGFKFNESDIKSEFGEEILMDIKEEEIDIKDEVPTTSSFHNDSDQDVDGNVSSTNLHKSNSNNCQYLLTDYKTPEKKWLVCNICGYKCDRKYTLTVHMRSHTREKPFVCGLCDYKSAHKSNLTRHMTGHTGEKPFVCGLCGYESAHTSHLTIHMRNHTGEKLFSCGLCYYKTAYKSNLTRHMRGHTGEKPFVCGLCDYKAPRKSNLTVHVRGHSEEKPFVCGLCDYKTIQKYHLTNHMRIHTGEKPFGCDLCDYKTAQKSHLTVHVKSHTGEKPFVCGICDYKSVYKSGLTIHMRSHTGEKFFSCGLCDYKTAYKYNLTVHMKSHSGENSFVCDLCGHKSARKDHLVIHIKSHLQH